MRRSRPIGKNDVDAEKRKKARLRRQGTLPGSRSTIARGEGRARGPTTVDIITVKGSVAMSATDAMKTSIAGIETETETEGEEGIVIGSVSVNVNVTGTESRIAEKDATVVTTTTTGDAVSGHLVATEVGLTTGIDLRSMGAVATTGNAWCA